jgi:hypothetical protein
MMRIAFLEKRVVSIRFFDEKSIGVKCLGKICQYYVYMDFTPNDFTPKFDCKNCGITCSKQSDWNRHILTNKHKKWGAAPKESAPHECEICEKKFSSKYELKKHTNTKVHENAIIAKNKSEVANIPESPDLAAMILEVIKNNAILQQQNQELQKQILDICKTTNQTTINQTNNNNQKFNINVFLTEQCKDAINFSDFIKSIEVSREDLENNAQLGFVNGVSKILIDHLNRMSVNERPIHCTDVKRETMYIKDEDKWTREEDSTKINKAIQTVTMKSMGTLMNWKEENPDYKDRDSEFSERCIVIQQQSMAAHNRDTYYPKVVKAVAKEVVVDKTP